MEAGIRLLDLHATLVEHGLAFPNLGSVLEQSIAGAISTGTHGSGLTLGSLSTTVVAMDIVLANATLVTVSETSHPQLLDAVRVSLGALGIIVRVTLQLRSAFGIVSKRSLVDVSTVYDNFDELVHTHSHFRVRRAAAVAACA